MSENSAFLNRGIVFPDRSKTLIAYDDEFKFIFETQTPTQLRYEAEIERKLWEKDFLLLGQEVAHDY